jgi:hypothetical protein
MTSAQWAAIERQARVFVQPRLRGIEADAAVRGIVAWEWANPDASPDRRMAAWSRIAEHVAYAF